MKIKIIKDNRKQFLNLLLIGDEQEDMIDKYLDRGDVFALYDDDLRGICIVTDEGDSVCELKNIAVYPEYQRKGYAGKLIQHILQYYKGKYKTMLVGTGDSDSIIPFYEHYGFKKSHRIKNFFIDNYEKPIIDNGKQLVDMVYLKLEL